MQEVRWYTATYKHTHVHMNIHTHIDIHTHLRKKGSIHRKVHKNNLEHIKVGSRAI